MSGKVGAIALGTNLVIHHGVTDIVSQAAKLLHILSTVQELCDPSLLLQWDELLKNIIQSPNGWLVLDHPPTLEGVGLLFKDLPSLFLLCLTLGNRCTQ